MADLFGKGNRAVRWYYRSDIIIKAHEGLIRSSIFFDRTIEEAASNEASTTIMGVQAPTSVDRRARW
jgi:hypothetical protein